MPRYDIKFEASKPLENAMKDTNDLDEQAKEMAQYLHIDAKMVDPQTDLIIPKAAHGLTDYLNGIRVSIDPDLPEGQGPTGTAAREKKVMVVQAIDNDPRFLPWKETAKRFGLRSSIALPLVIAGDAKGVLNIYSARHASFTDTEIALLEEVAGDISYSIDHMEKEKEVERLLFWDTLTNLKNHNYFTSWLAYTLQAMDPASDQLMVVVMDIDHFGTINHALGVNMGDLVLKEITNRLNVFAGDTGEVARFGADEFGLAIHIHDKTPLTVVEELRWLISQHPIRLDGDEISISASMGLAVFPDDGLQAGQLIERAKMALSNAKKRGEDQILFYSHRLFEQNLKRLEMERGLKAALKNQEFVLFFQPKIDLATREIAGFEALIRWQHPVKGLIPPGEFIPFCDSSGLIVEIGRWVMEEAIRHIKESPACKDPRMVLSFNVSIKQFGQPGFVQELIETVKASGVDPKRLQIEITESLFMENPLETIKKLTRIRDAGLNISIDDFGTGYSSLKYLKDIPASTLKIDYSFVKGLPDEKNDLEIVKTILLLADGLNKKTVAEGVETREQLVFLAGLGVDEAQGFYFARPMPKGECLKWMQDYRPETYFWPKKRTA